jgi:hypothetical protein
VPDCRTTATDHAPPPPPASVTENERVAESPGRSRPNESPVGFVKICGSFARRRSMRPPPWRIEGASTPLLRAGTAVDSSADFTCAGVHCGWRSSSRATPPATCGLAMLVPLKPAHSPCERGTADRTATPGALTSGFICREYGVGPPDENDATMSGVCVLAPPVVAATVIA